MPAAAAGARAFVGEVCAGWAVGHLVSDGELIVSELIANCVVATPGGPAWVLVVRDRGVVWVCVWDSSPVPPQVRVCGLDAESGRRLRIVAAIADGHGAFRVAEPQGKIAWARLEI